MNLVALQVLTPQELRVGSMAANGMLNKQIASKLGVSEQTIKNHMSNIFSKLNIDTRVQLVPLYRDMLDQNGVCSLCRGVGWILDCNPDRNPLNVEVIPCIMPECNASGRALAILCVNDLGLTTVASHPTTKVVMSLSKAQ